MTVGDEREDARDDECSGTDRGDDRAGPGAQRRQRRYGHTRPSSRAPRPRPASPVRIQTGTCSRSARARGGEDRERHERDARAGEAPAVEVAGIGRSDHHQAPRQQEADGGEGRAGDRQPADEVEETDAKVSVDRAARLRRRFGVVALWPRRCGRPIPQRGPTDRRGVTGTAEAVGRPDGCAAGLPARPGRTAVGGVGDADGAAAIAAAAPGSGHAPVRAPATPGLEPATTHRLGDGGRSGPAAQVRARQHRRRGTEGGPSRRVVGRVWIGGRGDRSVAAATAADRGAACRPASGRRSDRTRSGRAGGSRPATGGLVIVVEQSLGGGAVVDRRFETPPASLGLRRAGPWQLGVASRGLERQLAVDDGGRRCPGGSYSTAGRPRSGDAARQRRLPATDANSSPQDGHDSRPFGTSAAHAPQTIDCAVIRHLVCVPTLPAGRMVVRVTDASKF